MGWRKKEETPKTNIQTRPEVSPDEILMLRQKVADLERQKAPVQNIQTERTEVVKELPMQPIRKYKDENGQIVNLITIEEALNLIVNS